MQLRTADRKPNANNESNIRNLWNNIKHANLSITGIPEGKKEKGDQNVFEEVIAENFPNLKKETYPSTGLTEGPKQNESKHSHTNTYYS